MNTPHDDFDERAREAGRALRQPAPADGLTRINRARRNRRIAQVGGGLAVAAIAAGAVVLLVNRGDDETIVTTDPTTVPTTVPVDTTVPVTDPAVAPTTVPPTVPGTTAAPEPGGLVPTVWVGQKLAGWYDGDVFVPFEFGGEPPDGLVGAEVEVTLEIKARRPEGFDEATIRTVSENSRTLKFEQFGFEKE